MTRKEFLKEMLKYIFGRSGIKYLTSEGNTAKYTANSTLLGDCTYSDNYQRTISEIISPLFDEKIEYITIDEKKIKHRFTGMGQ